MEEEDPQEEPAKVGHLDNSNRKKKVGNYLLGNIVGEGSFSKVRQGLHIIAREKVAVKIVSKKAVLLRDVVKRSVRREAVLLQRLNHPNIVRLYEIMETENSYYLVQELAESGDFIKYLSKKKKLEELEVQKYIRQIASALDHMHMSNIAHRDLKLENLLLDKELNIKIIDFGLGNVFYGENSLSTKCGSSVYAAPEIFCHNNYGPGVDVWSMGICMYAMLMGRLPFPPDQADNLTVLQAAILRGPRIPDGLTIECTDLLSDLLMVDVSQRIQIDDVLTHPFLVGNYETPMVTRQPSIGQLYPIVPKATVVNYMTTVFHFMEDEIFYSVIERKMNAVAATYHLLQKRFDAGLHLVGSSVGSAGHLKGNSANTRTGGAIPVSANARSEFPVHEISTLDSHNQRDTESAVSKSTYKSYLQLLKDSKIRSAQSMRSTNSSHISQKELSLRRHKTRPSLTKNTKPQEETGFLPDFVLTYTDTNENVGNSRRHVGKYEWEQSFVITKKDTQKFDNQSKQQKQHEPYRAPSVFISGKEIFVRPPVQSEFERADFPHELFAPPSTPATPFIKERPFPRPIGSSKFRDAADDANDKGGGGAGEDSSSKLDEDIEDNQCPPVQKQRVLASSDSHMMNSRRIKDAAYHYGLNLAKSKPFVSQEVKSFFREIENAKVLGQGRKLVDRARNTSASAKFEELHSMWTRKSRTANSQRELPAIPTSTSVVRRPLSHDYTPRPSNSHDALTLPEVRGTQIDEMHLFDSPKQTVSGGVTDVIRVHITGSNKY